MERRAHSIDESMERLMRAQGRMIMKKRRWLALMMCVLTCLMGAIGSIAMAETVGRTLTLEYEALPDTTAYAAVTPYVEMRDNAIRLKYGDKITSVTVFYLKGDNWAEIKEDDAKDLPANTKYRFVFAYRKLSVSELINAGGQMVYEDLPDWFVPSGRGVLRYDGVTVASIDVVNGKIVITFDDEWLKQHSQDVLNGTFSVEGYIDWRALPSDGSGRVEGSDIAFGFENDLAQKYGDMRMEKSQPELVDGGDGKYYLKYQLTVTSVETVAIPDVTVKDLFSTAAYIKEYVGVTGSPAELPDAEQPGRMPWERRPAGNTPGRVSGDGGMLWEIGTLQPGEVRTLTYYAEIEADYVANVINNPIQNTAEAFAGTTSKGKSSSSFTPKNTIRVRKTAGETFVTSNGNGWIVYTVMIAADESNTFTLTDLTLKDAFPAELAAYLAGSEDTGIEVAVTAEDGSQTKYTVAYANASFELGGLSLKPGATITVTYKVKLNGIFFANNEDVIDLINTASVCAGNKSLQSANNVVSLEKKTWIRKIPGEATDAEQTLTVPTTDEVYEYSGNAIVKSASNPGSFQVPKGSVKYEVFLNEDGEWDLSSTTMKDAFGSEYLKYVGYVQVEAYEPGGDTVKTVWLKVDDQGSFEFRPTDLGLSGGKYAYKLTYYARPNDMDDIGSLTVSNSFSLSGTVVGEDGAMGIPGSIIVSAGKVVQGGSNFSASKTGWYYTSDPVFIPGTYTTATNPQATFDSDYENGAIYWIIRLEGTVPSGYASSGVETKNVQFEGFYLSDKPDTLTQFRRDSLVGVYRGPWDFDFTKYDSFVEIMNDKPDALTKLNGNPQNDNYFSGTQVANADYYWYAENEEIKGIVFKNDISLGANEAIYIILRTRLMAKVPTANGDSFRRYRNGLTIHYKNGPTVEATPGEYTYYYKTSMYKESKGAWRYDKANGTFKNISDRGSDWNMKAFIDEAMLTSSGIYATWLLNINWDGSMEGDYDIEDQLPSGMELVYADINNFGMGIRNNPALFPQTTYISELDSSPQWREIRHSNSVIPTNQSVEAITYYNQSTGQIRWHVSGLRQSDGRKQSEINFRIVCKISDPELFLNQHKTYVNTAYLLDDPDNAETADVTINLPIDKKLDTDVTGPLLNNELSFTITINPLAEDMCDGNTLPPLVDEMSKGILLIEDSVKITTADGQDFTNFTYTVTTGDDGQQLLIIYGLPDQTTLNITYKVRLDAEPKTNVDVSNTVYWLNYDRPNKPQVDQKNVSYSPEGDVFLDEKVEVNILKVDAASHSKRLDGAEFVLYAVEEDGTPKQPPIRRGVSDSYGEVHFDNKDTKLETIHIGSVYCIEEVSAPVGYELNGDDAAANRYYFIIINPNHKDDAEIAALKAAYEAQGLTLEVWYDSPAYKIILVNDKGKITVGKVFVKDGQVYTPTSGRYAFGLFDFNDQLLETLVIEYTNDGPIYYLDGLKTDKSNFSRNDPERAYKVYELDDDGNPILDDELGRLGGSFYRVTYSTDEVTVDSDITVTNTFTAETEPMSLTITKAVRGQDADKMREFTFEVTLTSGGQALDGQFAVGGNPFKPEGPTITFVDGKARVVLRHAECIVISGLPAGTAYTVRELDTDDYQAVPGTRQGAIAEGDRATAAFANYRVQKGVSKTVDDADRVVEMGQTLTYTINWANNSTTAASVMITDTLSDGLTYVSSTGGGILSADGKTVTWYLGEKEPYSSGSVTVTVIVNGNAWHIGEIDNTAYIQIGRETYPATVTVEVEVRTGGLRVSKTVNGTDGDPTEAFDFMVTLDNRSVSGVYGGVTFRQGTASFKLKHGESILITGLPIGTRYTVTELSANRNGYATVASNAEGTIPEQGVASVIFINTRDAAVVEVPKTGDESRLALWIALAAASLILMTLAMRRKA